MLAFAPDFRRLILSLHKSVRFEAVAHELVSDDASSGNTPLSEARGYCERTRCQAGGLGFCGCFPVFSIQWGRTRGRLDACALPRGESSREAIACALLCEIILTRLSADGSQSTSASIHQSVRGGTQIFMRESQSPFGDRTELRAGW